MNAYIFLFSPPHVWMCAEWRPQSGEGRVCIGIPSQPPSKPLPPPQRFCTVAPAPSCPGMLLNWHRFPEEPWCCVRDMNTQTHEHTHTRPRSVSCRGEHVESCWLDETDGSRRIVRKAPMASRSSPFFLVDLLRLGVGAILVVSTTRTTLAPISL